MTNKLIIISGANGNIGSVLADHFAKKGYDLLLLYHKKKSRVDEICQKYPSKSTALSVNLTEFTTSEKTILNVLKNINAKPTYIIHTAATRSYDSLPLHKSDPETWEDIFYSNTSSAYNLLRILLPIMRKNSRGKIIMFGSNVSRKGLKNGSAYAAAKSAISSLARTIALEEENIMINVISPGPVRIDDSHFSEEYRKFREDYYINELKSIPLKKLPTPENLIGICDFLLSDNNSFINGEEIFLTGGNL